MNRASQATAASSEQQQQQRIPEWRVRKRLVLWLLPYMLQLGHATFTLPFYPVTNL